jgi:MATE family multidrug resistance protein
MSSSASPSERDSNPYSALQSSLDQTENDPALRPPGVTLAQPVSPLREILTLAVPTVLQMLSYTVEQVTDAYMLAQVGNTEASAAVSAGMVTFCFISFGFGILMLVNALVSTAFGAERPRACGRYLWQGIWFGIVYSVFWMPAMFWSPQVFRLMGHDETLVALEVDYFNVTMSALVVKMLAVALGQFMLAVNRPNVVLWSAAAGMVGNIFVNWLLIYGHWGCPQLGVAGAAWGTNTAILIELLILAAVVFGPAIRTTFHTLDWRFDAPKFRELLRIGLPSGFQTTGDVVAWTIFLAVVMPRFGPAAFAACNYMLQYMKLSFMPAFGLSTAVTALVARYVGAGQPDVSEHRAHLAFKIATAYMLLCGVFYLVFRNDLMQLFNKDPAVVELGGGLLIICAIFQLFDAMFIVYIGALRGVKDTFWPSIVQIALCWGIVVAGGYGIAVFKPEWGVYGPWSMGIVYGIILGFYLMLRFRSGRWRTMQPESPGEAQTFDVAIAAAVEPIGK